MQTILKEKKNQINSNKKNLKKKQTYVPIGSTLWKSTSLTEPKCPGNLYMIFRELVSQMYTNLSADPADTISPSGDQAQCKRF